MRFGIPDFKFNKGIIDRRLSLLEKEGLIFKTNTHVGKDVNAESLLQEFDAICLAVGAMQPRDLDIPGRELKGIHFAMEYLAQQNRRFSGIEVADSERIWAENKHVVVIGGGDTGSDCVGTAIRQKAKSVTQIELLPKPSIERDKNNPWPYWPATYKTSSSHEEGCERLWSLETTKFTGTGRNVSHIELKEILWEKNNGRLLQNGNSGKKMVLEADLVLLALGFKHPVHEGFLNHLEISYDPRGYVSVDDNYQTSNPKVFAVGDAVEGPSLIVKALASGRAATGHIHGFLIYKSPVINHATKKKSGGKSVSINSAS